LPTKLRFRESVRSGIIYNTVMEPIQVVIDTNIIVAALRSKRGASHKLLMKIGSGKFEMNLSVPLLLEYEYAAKQLINETALTESDADDILDYLCSRSNKRKIYYLWRPFLRDAKDDLVLELAVAANCEYIVTFNVKDFQGAEQFGLRVRRPKEFLIEIGEAL